MQKPEIKSKTGSKRVERAGVPCGACPVAWRNRTKWTKAPIRCLVRAKNVVRGHYLLGWLQDQGVTYLRLSGRVIVRLAQVKKASCGGVTLTSHKSLLAILKGEKQFVPRPHIEMTRVRKPKVGPMPKSAQSGAGGKPQKGVHQRSRAQKQTSVQGPKIEALENVPVQPWRQWLASVSFDAGLCPCCHCLDNDSVDGYCRTCGVPAIVPKGSEPQIAEIPECKHVTGH